MAFFFQGPEQTVLSGGAKGLGYVSDYGVQKVNLGSLLKIECPYRDSDLVNLE